MFTPDDVKGFIRTAPQFLQNSASLIVLNGPHAIKIVPLQSTLEVIKATTEVFAISVMQRSKEMIGSIHGDGGNSVFPCILDASSFNIFDSLKAIIPASSMTCPAIWSRFPDSPALCIVQERVNPCITLEDLIIKDENRRKVDYEDRLRLSIYFVLLTILNWNHYKIPLEGVAGEDREGEPDEEAIFFHNDLNLKNILVNPGEPRDCLMEVREGNRVKTVIVPNSFSVAITDFNIAELSRRDTLNLIATDPLHRVHGLGPSDSPVRPYYDVLYFLNSIYIVLKGLMEIKFFNLKPFEAKLLRLIEREVPECFLGQGYTFKESTMSPQTLEAKLNLVEGRPSTFGTLLKQDVLMAPWVRNSRPHGENMLLCMEQRDAAMLETYFDTHNSREVAEDIIHNRHSLCLKDFSAISDGFSFESVEEFIRSLLRSDCFLRVYPEPELEQKMRKERPVSTRFLFNPEERERVRNIDRKNSKRLARVNPFELVPVSDLQRRGSQRSGPYRARERSREKFYHPRISHRERSNERENTKERERSTEPSDTPRSTRQKSPGDSVIEDFD